MTQPKFLTNMFNDHFEKQLIMNDAYADAQDVKRELTQYVDHDITDNELQVHWVLGNKIDMGTKVFKLQDFYAWCEGTCTDKSNWSMFVELDKDDVDSRGDGRQVVFDIDSYVECYEETLVKEFFNKMK